ncbi:TPA: hypothetical protein N0F65_006148 [Lagenidium giganteum]|uniref:Uncharacterized protein n=1 Tax=Lagenidium giganteum TaxID=4803 RepID=A0AAV2Z6I2_9STRA|nr:TPA: hypothetical protein N0F65_006148 [Lagenidium giganteum]
MFAKLLTYLIEVASMLKTPPRFLCWCYVCGDIEARPSTYIDIVRWSGIRHLIWSCVSYWKGMKC